MLQNTIGRSLLHNKIKDKITMLGIVYSFSKQTKENWIVLQNKIENVINQQLGNHLTLYGKIQVINTLIIPLCLHKIYALVPDLKFINSINNMLFKFLWDRHRGELVNRNIVICDYKDGGIKMIHFLSKCVAASLYKLKIIANSINKTEFWIQWAVYNIGSLINTINSDLYTNTEPHSLIPSSYWGKIQKFLCMFKDKVEDWRVVKYKHLYNICRDNYGKPASSKSNCVDKNFWTRVQLKTDNIVNNHYFTNEERETCYLSTHEAYRFGQWKKFHLPFIDVQTWLNYACPFCKKHYDNAKHILFECDVTKKLFTDIIDNVSNTSTKRNFMNNFEAVLYNKFNSQNTEQIQCLKFFCIIKKLIINYRLKLESYGMNNICLEQYRLHILYNAKFQYERFLSCFFVP